VLGIGIAPGVSKIGQNDKIVFSRARGLGAASFFLIVLIVLIVLTGDGVDTPFDPNCPPSALMRQIGRIEEGRISGSS
jgi:hypothetical protein